MSRIYKRHSSKSPKYPVLPIRPSDACEIRNIVEGIIFKVTTGVRNGKELENEQKWDIEIPHGWMHVKNETSEICLELIETISKYMGLPDVRKLFEEEVGIDRQGLIDDNDRLQHRVYELESWIAELKIGSNKMLRSKS